MNISTIKQSVKIARLTLVSFLLLIISMAVNAQNDKYWSGNGTNDDLGTSGNWFNGNPASGDNVYFNNTLNRHNAYSNYAAGSYFNFFITYNGAGGIKLYGDNTYAYKFENNSDPVLLELGPSSASPGNREIGNRINNDLEINPVGSGGILISCDKVSMDNLNGTRTLRIYGNNTLTVNGSIYEKNGTGTPLQIMNAATVELKGNCLYSGLTTINGGTLRLNASGGALKSGNAVTISGGTLRVMQSQTIGNLTMSSGTLLVDAGVTLTITGTYNVTGGTVTNNGTIQMAGTSAQNFPGSASISAMNNVTINNSSATGVTLNSSSLTVAGTLTFLANGGNKALLTTGSNVIVATTVSGASSANGWVNGNLDKNITSSGAKLFDIGDANNYTPASLNISVSGLTAGILRASTRPTISTATGFATLSLLTSPRIDRVWSVTKPGGSTFTGSYTGTFTYVAGDLIGSPVIGNLRSASYNGSMWYYPGTVIPGTLQVTMPALSSPFAVYDFVFATARPVTVTGVTVTPKVYDAGLTANLNFGSATLVGVQGGNFVNINSGSATGSYDNKNVGNGKPVTISGVALATGLDAGAYVLSAQPSASGNITQRPLTITAVTNSKPYDGNTSAAAIPNVSSGVIQLGDAAAFLETYDTKNAGTGKTLTPSGIVSDGNSGNNYSYSFVTNNTGIITNIPITNLTATPGNIACNGGTTTVTVGASGGDGVLQYSLSGTANFPYQLSNVFTGVSAGTYTLTVKDEDDFTAQLSGIVVGQPATFTAAVLKTNVSACNNTNDGTITITPAGGSGNYNYSWTGVTGSGNPASTPYPNPGNVSSLSNLPIGFYNVTITDAGGCGFVQINDIHIGYAFTVYVTANASISSGCGNTGSITLYGNAGVAPYTYSINGVDYQPSQTFSNLAANTYTGYIKDAAGCVGTKANIVVGAAAPIVVNPFTRAASSCANDGSIEIYRTGGVGPYTYSLDNNTYQSSNTFTGKAAGTYTAYVKDSKGCVNSAQAVVAQGVGLSVSFNKTNASTCVTDGSIQVNASGGVYPYQYSLNGGAYQSGNSFTGLAAGNYTVVVKDFKNCLSEEINVTINTNTITVLPYVVNASSCASSNGSIQLFRTGGVGPYTYSLDGNTYQASNLFTNKAPGTYSGFVKDSKTCVAQLDDIIVGPSCERNTVTRNAAAAEKVTVISSFKVQAYPNPTATEFTLQLQGFTTEKVNITVTDVMGRIVYQSMGTGKQQYRFGNAFTAGIYNVQVIQGNQKQSIKLVKE